MLSKSLAKQLKFEVVFKFKAEDKSLSMFHNAFCGNTNKFRDASILSWIPFIIIAFMKKTIMIFSVSVFRQLTKKPKRKLKLKVVITSIM